MTALHRISCALLVFALLVTPMHSATAAPVLLCEESSKTAIARLLHETAATIPTQATFSYTLDHTQTEAFAAQFATPQHHKTITSSKLAHFQEITDPLSAILLQVFPQTTNHIINKKDTNHPATRPGTALRR